MSRNFGNKLTYAVQQRRRVFILYVSHICVNIFYLRLRMFCHSLFYLGNSLANKITVRYFSVCVRRYVVCLPFKFCLLFRWSSEEEWEGGHGERMGDRRGTCTSFCGKPEGKKPLGRPSGRWQDNIKMYIQQVDGETRKELMRLRTETNDEHCWMR